MTSIGSGLSAQIGFAQETTPGTPVTPNRFYEFTSETLAMTKKVVQGQSIGAGQKYDRGSRRATTQRSAGGDVTMDLPVKGLGLLLQHMLGSFTATATQQGSSQAYLQVHTPGPGDGKALTIQKGVPRTDGTVEPFTYPGSKITAWEFNCAQSELVTAKFTFDSVDELTTATNPAGPALATASYANAQAFNFVQGALVSGGTVSTTSGVTSVTGATPVAAVRSVNIKGTNAVAADRFFLGSATKAEQIQNAWSTVTGSFDLEFASRALYDQYRADQTSALQLTFTGPQIATGQNYLLQILIPQMWVEDGVTPQVGGPDIVVPSVPFTGTFDGTNPAIQISYQTTDTAV